MNKGKLKRLKQMKKKKVKKRKMKRSHQSKGKEKILIDEEETGYKWEKDNSGLALKRPSTGPRGQRKQRGGV